jgi:hypothetical protein
LNKTERSPQESGYSATQALKYLRDVGFANTDEEEHQVKIGTAIQRLAAGKETLVEIAPLLQRLAPDDIEARRQPFRPGRRKRRAA